MVRGSSDEVARFDLRNGHRRGTFRHAARRILIHHLINMASKTTKAKMSKSSAGKSRANYRVRIRMYRHGLGDCFLLSFPNPGGKDVHVMIDCGVVLGTSEPDAVMKKV